MLAQHDADDKPLNYILWVVQWGLIPFFVARS